MINQYLNDINSILDKINSNNVTLAIQIASIPEMIRGYGHVKEENISKASEKREDLLKLWRSKNRDDLKIKAAE